jgi:D-alanyl-lipoteichoic acid acyltransferase DltB (MBOAT superfamily)
LAASVTVVLGALFVFKYFDFFVGSMGSVLPALRPSLPTLNFVVAAGLSFYSFSSVSYLADVHARRLPAERHFGHFALYIAFFPKLLAGPIERARPFLEQVRQPARFSTPAVVAGLQLILWGLFKKVVIADRLAAFVDSAYRAPSFASPADLVIATYFFAFQLYCDFSGYSDIAIGSAKVLGFDLRENFRRPYLATSVREFWASRWHLSLSAWFRDYMYIPLGGSRGSTGRRALNLLAVFVVSGLWHGANWTFVVWGGLNGLYQVLAVTLGRRIGFRDRLPTAVAAVWGWLLTFHLILLTWVFFRSASIEDAVTVVTRIAQSASVLPGLIITRLSGGEVLVSVILIAVLMAVELIDEKRPMWNRLRAQPRVIRWAAYYALLLCLLVLGRWNLQQFVYMQF